MRSLLGRAGGRTGLRRDSQGLRRRNARTQAGLLGRAAQSLFASTLELRRPEATRKLDEKYFRSDDFSTSTNPLFHTDFYVLRQCSIRFSLSKAPDGAWRRP